MMKSGSINTVSQCKQSFFKFLSASLWSSLVCSEILQEALPDDLTLHVVHFPSSREAASKYSHQNSLHQLAHFFFRIYHPITLLGIGLFNLARVSLGILCHLVSCVTWYPVSLGILCHLVSCVTWYPVSLGILCHLVSCVTWYPVSLGILCHLVSCVTWYPVSLGIQLEGPYNKQ